MFDIWLPKTSLTNFAKSSSHPTEILGSARLGRQTNKPQLVSRQVRPDMHQHQLFHSCFLGHPGRARCPTLAIKLAVLFHDFLVIPAHTKQKIGSLRQAGNAGARPGIPS